MRGCIRLGSTDRRADPQMVHELRLLARNTEFDEQPSWNAARKQWTSELFTQHSRRFVSPYCR